jgi:acyl-CoA synthetase (AMP-forming)/AMP-acid ligase II
MNLVSLLDLPALIAPDAPAVIGCDDRYWTYDELADRCARIATLIAGRGVEQGSRVAVLSTNSVDAVAGVLAASRLGAIAVPMNFKASDVELEHLLADSGAAALLVESRYLTAVERVRPASLSCVLVLDDPAFETAVAAAEPHDEAAEVEEDDLAVLLYTSGTTSHPKGVQLTHGALTGYVMGSNDAADGSDNGRMLLAAPLYHVAGLTSLLHSLYSGRTTVLIPQFDVDGWLDAVERHAVTHGFLVPTMLARIIDSPRLGAVDLASLQAITYGAAPMPPAVIERAIGLFPDTVEFSGAYGQTETTSTVAVLGPEDHRLVGSPEEVAMRRARLRSVGKVLDEVELRIVDDEGQPVPAGVVGEVQLRTPRVMRGYWGNEERTRVTVDDEGWVHTGDLGWVDDDDYLFLSGRRGDMIVRGGENVSPEEVEVVLFEHPGVVDAGVCGVPDLEWGERIVATVALSSGVDLDQVMAHVRDRLAPFKRPAEYHVVDALPRTSTGKLLRRELVAQFSDPSDPS